MTQKRVAIVMKDTSNDYHIVDFNEILRIYEVSDCAFYAVSDDMLKSLRREAEEQGKTSPFNSAMHQLIMQRQAVWLNRKSSR